MTSSTEITNEASESAISEVTQSCASNKSNISKYKLYDAESMRRKIIYIYKNGDEFSRAKPILLNQLEQKDLELTLRAIEDKIILPLNKPIHRIYDIKGNRIRNVDQIIEGDFYVAAGFEKFCSKRYGHLLPPMTVGKLTNSKYHNMIFLNDSNFAFGKGHNGLPPNSSTSPSNKKRQFRHKNDNTKSMNDLSEHTKVSERKHRNYQRKQQKKLNSSHQNLTHDSDNPFNKKPVIPPVPTRNETELQNQHESESNDKDILNQNEDQRSEDVDGNLADEQELLDAEETPRNFQNTDEDNLQSFLDDEKNLNGDHEDHESRENSHLEENLETNLNLLEDDHNDLEYVNNAQNHEDTALNSESNGDKAELLDEMENKNEEINNALGDEQEDLRNLQSDDDPSKYIDNEHLQENITANKNHETNPEE